MRVTNTRIVTAMAVALLMPITGGCGNSEPPPATQAPPAPQPPATPGAAAVPAKQPRTTHLGQALDKAENVRDLAAEHDRAILDVTK